MIAGIVALVFLVSTVRSSVKHTGFFGSLYWTLRGTTLIIYHVLAFVGAIVGGFISALSEAKTGKCTVKKQRRAAASVFMSEKTIHEAVARHLANACHVKAHINVPIPGLKGVRKLRRPDVWAQGNNLGFTHQWYICEVKDSKRGWTADLDRAPFQLGTLRTAVRERYGGNVSCFIGVTERLYSRLSEGKLAQLHDEVRERCMGVLIVRHDGRCEVEYDFRGGPR